MSKVDTQHPEYMEMLPKWQKCSDVIDGQDAVHAAGTKYLPQLLDQEDSEYRAYKQRAVFYNASKRTLVGLNGLLLRKKFTIDSTKIGSYEDDITYDGKSLDSLVMEVTEDVLEYGRVGLLIDLPSVKPEQAVTVADVEKLNIRPRVCFYEAEQIINWKTNVINNKVTVTMVVLTEEEATADTENRFAHKCDTVYRVLELVNGVYTSSVYKINEKKEDVLVSSVTPVMNNKPLDFIPFFFINSTGMSPCPDEPPLLDLVNLNLAHYRVSADYEHGCHFTGLPTPVVAGIDSNPTEKLYIGSSAAWTFPNPQAKAYFLEFSGQGLSALENNLKTKEEQMAILGARMLASDKKAAEAAETAAIRRAGENSALAGIGNAISKGLSAALTVFSKWAGSDEPVTLTLNTDFSDIGLSSQDLTALVSAWQQGAISHETLFNNLKAGEIYDESVDFEDEQKKIDDAITNRPSTNAPGGPIPFSGQRESTSVQAAGPNAIGTTGQTVS